MNASNFGSAANVTASGSVNPTSGRMLGFYVNSTTAGTIAFRDGGASGTVLTGTITPAVGWHPLPITYGTDLYATIGGTLNVTAVYS